MSKKYIKFAKIDIGIWYHTYDYLMPYNVSNFLLLLAGFFTSQAQYAVKR